MGLRRAGGADRRGPGRGGRGRRGPGSRLNGGGDTATTVADPSSDSTAPADTTTDTTVADDGAADTTDTTAADSTDTTGAQDDGAEDAAADPNGNVNDLPLNSGVQTGTVFNDTPYGEIPAATPQVLVLRPGSGRIIPINQEIQLRARFSNFKPGTFSDPASEYGKGTQRLDENGNLNGHNHACIQRVARDGSVPGERCDSFGRVPGGHLRHPHRHRAPADPDRPLPRLHRRRRRQPLPGRPGVRPARWPGGLRAGAGHEHPPAAPGAERRQPVTDPVRHQPRPTIQEEHPFMLRRVTMAAVVAVVAATMVAPAALAQDDYSTTQVEYGDDVYGGTEGGTESGTSESGHKSGGA